MKKIIYLFYNHYNRGSSASSAYQSALWAVLTLFMVNAVSAMLYVDFALLKKYSHINGRNWEQNLLALFTSYFVVGYHILWMLYKKDKIEAINYSPDFIKRKGRWLVGYIIASLSVFVLMVAKYYTR